MLLLEKLIINKIVLSSNDDKRIQTTKNLVNEKEAIKFNNIIKRCKK